MQLNMLKNAFIDVRDFVYIWLMNDHNEDYASKEYKFRIGVLFVMYYMSVFITISLFIPFSIGSVIFSSDLNVFQKLIGGSVAFLPYYAWLKFYLYPMLDKQPIDFEGEKSSISHKKWKTIGLLFGGFCSILLVGLISNLIRSSHV